MVEFCPRCGSILVPQKKEGSTVLVCRRCGYQKKAEGSGYKQSETVDKKSKTKVTVVSREEVAEGMSEEQRELLKEYYEVFLSTMEESGEE